MSNVDYNMGWGENSLRDIDRLNIMREKFSTDEEDLRIDAVLSRKTGIRAQTISEWQKGKGKLFSTTKSKIAKALNLRYNVWVDPYPSYAENIFFQKLEDYLIDTPKEKDEEVIEEQDEDVTEEQEDTGKLDGLVYTSIVNITAEEEDMLAHFVKDDTIEIPGNLERHSPEFMFSLAQHLKAKKQAKDALHVLDVLQSTPHSYKYQHRKEIAHLRAILLSESSVQKWDEAIEVLYYLYGDKYHYEIPEIVTLTASNYKRKALYHPNGKINHADYVETDALATALSLYNEAYDLKPETEKYYDTVNIAYLEFILEALEGRESEESVHERVEKLFKDAYRKKLDNGEYEDIPTDMKNWWEVTTKVEFYILLGDDASAIELYEAYEGTPTPFQLGTTIRQLELYTHFVNDDVAKGFLEVLKADLEKL